MSNLIHFLVSFFFPPPSSWLVKYSLPLKFFFCSSSYWLRWTLCWTIMPEGIWFSERIFFFFQLEQQISIGPVENGCHCRPPDTSIKKREKGPLPFSRRCQSQPRKERREGNSGLIAIRNVSVQTCPPLFSFSGVDENENLFFSHVPS